jgi:hypothetical protein
MNSEAIDRNSPIDLQKYEVRTGADEERRTITMKNPGKSYHK